MNKTSYLNELKKRLALLNSKEVDDIVEEYLDYVDQKVCDGATEEEALESLGNVNDLAKSILQAYKISDKYIKLFIGKEKIVDEMNDFTNKVVDDLTEFSSKVADGSKEVFTKIEGTTKKAFKETVKFGENRIKDVKGIFNKLKDKKEDSKDSEEKEEE